MYSGEGTYISVASKKERARCRLGGHLSTAAVDTCCAWGWRSNFFDDDEIADIAFQAHPL